MTNRQTPRLIGLTILTLASLFLQQDRAFATVVPEAGGRVEDRFEHISDDTSCVGASALQAVSFTVNGQSVSSLEGNVPVDSRVSVTFTLAGTCDNVKLGLASYISPTDYWDPALASRQKLIDQQTGTFSAGSTSTLNISVSDCYFQLDFFTGDARSSLGENSNYATPINNLIASANGGIKLCDVDPVSTTSVDTTPVTTTVVTLLPTVENTPIAESTVVEQTEVASEIITQNPSTQELAETGSDTAALSILATALVLSGAVFEQIARRRRRNV